MITNSLELAEGTWSHKDLLEAVHFNETLVNTIPFGLDVVDKHGTILFANGLLRKALGGDIVGKRCWEVYKDDKTQCACCPLRESIFIGETKTTETGGCLGGRTLMVTHTGMKLKGKGAMLEIFQDITERRRWEEEVKKTMEARSGFISMVSHELRTPLTAIKEGVDIILDGEAGAVTDDQREFLGLAKRNVDRLARLINDVLNLQKLGAGMSQFNFKPEDLARAVREVHETMLPLAAAKGLELRFECEEALPPVPIDRDKIIQVVTNLANNAIKFTETGSVSLRVASGGPDALRVEVSDTGPGIAPEDMPGLFTSFAQFGKAVEMTGSSGLGLAISKKIVEGHRGTIEAESVLERGTVFTVTLPKTRRGMKP